MNAAKDQRAIRTRCEQRARHASRAKAQDGEIVTFPNRPPSRSFLQNEIRRVARKIRSLREKNQELLAIEVWSLKEDLKGLISMLETSTDFERVEVP